MSEKIVFDRVQVTAGVRFSSLLVHGRSIKLLVVDEYEFSTHGPHGVYTPTGRKLYKTARLQRGEGMAEGNHPEHDLITSGSFFMRRTID